MRRDSFIGMALAALVACSPARANDDVQGWQVNWDNDVWGKGKTDRWYTNGLRLSWTYNTPPTSAVSRLLRDGSQWFLWDATPPTLTYSVGQTMYTPRDITRAEPQREDRPWGAFLFTSVTAHAFRDRGPDQGSEFRATELKTGLVSKYALGEQAQKFVHRYVTDSPMPAGWDQQLRTRLGVQLSHARAHQLGDRLLGDRIGFQWGWGAAAGTVRTHGNLNIAITAGDLSDRNAPILIGNEGDFVVQDFSNRPQFARPFFYLAANVTGVAYNYFLDGDTPYGRSDLERKRSYTMFTLGASLPLQRWIGSDWPRLVYAQSTRSAEFRSRTIGRDEHRQRWGTFSLHWDLDR